MVKLIDRNLIEETSRKALLSPRSRMNCNLHELSDPVQRMLNAIEPESYIRPHRHRDPDKSELFVILRGRGAVITFDGEGRAAECHALEAGGDRLGVEIPPGTWHTVVSLESGTVFLEVKDGPYAAISDKDFAGWAPAPEDAVAKAYLEELRREIQISRGK